MPNSKTFDRWQARQRDATVKMLELLIKRIRSGKLIVSHSGMWNSRLDNKVFIQVEVLSEDSQEELKKFGSI